MVARARRKYENKTKEEPNVGHGTKGKNVGMKNTARVRGKHEKLFAFPFVSTENYGVQLVESKVSFPFEEKKL